MAVVGDLVANLSVNSRGFSAGINQARGTLASFGSGTRSILSGISGQLGAMFGGASLLGGMGLGLKLAADAETTQIAFEVMIGSAEKAKSLLMDLKAFSDKSPLSMIGVQNGAKMLMQYGMEVQDVIPSIKRLGDIAGADEERFSSLAYAFGQITSYGRLHGQELRQLINSGYNPLQDISNRTGESMADLKKRMSEGGISAQEINQALIDATSSGGRFFNMTSRQSETLTGRFSTFKDSINSNLRDIGQALSDNLDLKGVLGSAAEGLTNFSSNLSIQTMQWTIDLENFSTGAGGVFQNLMIVSQAAWNAMAVNFKTFLHTMAAGLQEGRNWFKAEGSGLREFWDKSAITNAPRNALDWLDRNDFDNNSNPETADWLFGKHRQQSAMDTFTGKPLTAWEAHNRARDRELAGQPDAIKPGTDTLSMFMKEITEKNAKLRAELGNGGLKDLMEKQMWEKRWDIAERGGGSGIDFGGRLGASFTDAAKAEDAKRAASVRHTTEAALKGSQAAARIALTSVNNPAVKEQQKANKLLEQIANSVKPGHGQQMKLLVGEV